MNTRSSTLMARLKVAEGLDKGEVLRDQGQQDCNKVTKPVTTVSALAANEAIERQTLWRHPCGTCQHRCAPGAAWPGYCGKREDMPWVYGLLHVLPADLGEDCGHHQPRGGG